MSDNQNEKDYSEYDVNSDDPVPNDQPAEDIYAKKRKNGIFMLSFWNETHVSFSNLI